METSASRNLRLSQTLYDNYRHGLHYQGISGASSAMNLDGSNKMCEICGCSSLDVFLVRKTGDPGPPIRYCFCRSCATQYVSPRPDFSTNELGAVYDEEYGEHGPGLLGLNLDYKDESALRVYKLCYKRQMQLIEKLNGHGKGRLLDIGCGLGWFLYSAKQRGWEVCGVDVSPRFTKHVKEKLGIENVYTGTLEDLSLSEGQFDVVTLKEVIEHVLYPVQLIQEAGRLVKKGGLIFVETPNPGSARARIARLLCRLTGSGQFAAGTMLYPPIHLWGFSHRALKMILSQTGLAPEKMFTVSYGRNPWLFIDCCVYPDFYGDGIDGARRRLGYLLDFLGAPLSMGTSTIAFARRT